MLFRCLSRSRECQLRKASYEPGAWFQRGGLWIGCRAVFHRLFPVRGAFQHLSRASWRAALDRPHYDLLGDRFGCVRRYSIDSWSNWNFERSGLLYASFVARRMRGRFLPWHHLLFNLVVSSGVSRSGNQLLHAGDPNFIHRRSTDLRIVAERDWVGLGRLAMAVHSRGAAIDPGRTRCARLSDRFSAPGPLVAEGRNCLVGDRASNREKEQGEGRTSFPVSGPHGYPHFALRSGILLSECGELRSGLLLANHHQGLWR